MSTAASPVKKASQSKKTANHPAYTVMVSEAISSLKERSGSSKIAVLKFIVNKYNVSNDKKTSAQVRLALLKMVKSGALKQTKGTGANGSFRLGEKPKAAKKPKAAAAKKVKKPKAAKATKPKKPAGEKKVKSPKKAMKPAAKKASKPKAKTPKKAKKPAAKKTPAKKATPKKEAKKAAKK